MGRGFPGIHMALCLISSAAKEKPNQTHYVMTSDRLLHFCVSTYILQEKPNKRFGMLSSQESKE